METVFAILAIPVMLLNFLAGIVGGIALLLKGEWGAFALGLGYGLLGPLLIGFLMLPGLLVAAPLAAKGVQKSGLLTGFFGLLAMSWTYVVMTFTSVTIFAIITAVPESGFFHLLWGYSSVTAPWSYMANKERQSGNPDAAIPVFFLQLATISMLVGRGVFDAPTNEILLWFLPFALLGMIVQFVLAMLVAREERRFTTAFRPTPPRRIADAE